MHHREGLFLLLIAAMGYALLPLLAKWAYAANLMPLDVVMWRFLFATPLVWLLVLLRRQPRAEDLPRGLLVGAGLLFGLVAATAFLALARLPASVYIVLLYSYPALVTLMMALRGERLSRQGIAALLLTMLGVVLVVPPPSEGLGAISAAGLALAMLNALLYSLYIVVSGIVLRGHRASLEAGAWSITGSLLTLGVLALVRGGVAIPATAMAWLSVLGLALFSTVIPISAFYAGMQRVGAAQASIISTVEPLMTLLMAVTLLRERLQPLQLLGSALILASVLILTVRRR